MVDVYSRRRSRDTDEEDWVEADRSAYDLCEIDEDWKYFTKTLKKNIL